MKLRKVLISSLLTFVYDNGFDIGFPKMENVLFVPLQRHNLCRRGNKYFQQIDNWHFHIDAPY